MKVKFWGVRGSYPTPSKNVIKYGGNTSCVEVGTSDGSTIILDGGTGIRNCGKSLMKREFSEGKGKAYILISHTHWDHIQGFPFFEPIYKAGNEFEIFAKNREDRTLQAIFAGQVDKEYFPVPLDQLLEKTKIDFVAVEEDSTFEVDNVKVKTTRLNHPYIALAYRLSFKNKIFAYVTDTAPFKRILMETEYIQKPPDKNAPVPEDKQKRLDELELSLLKLIENADLVIYDTHFTTEEYEMFPHWGHTTPEDALQNCYNSGVKHLVLFHHAPARTDEQLEKIHEKYLPDADKKGIKLSLAQEGAEIVI